MARPQSSGFQRRALVFLDQLTNVIDLIRLQRRVHEPADALLHQRPAGPEDVQRHQAGDQGVQHHPARHDHQRHADEHAAGGVDVGHEMAPIGRQRGRA